MRCQPSLEHLGVVYEDGTEAEMVANPEIHGLRLEVFLVAPEARLREVIGTTGDRTGVERFDLRGHDGSWHSRRAE